MEVFCKKIIIKKIMHVELIETALTNVKIMGKNLIVGGDEANNARVVLVRYGLVVIHRWTTSYGRF